MKIVDVTKPGLKYVIQKYRMVTYQMRLLPDFLIIGAQRSGTSSLYYYLTGSPWIAPAFTKELHFFDDHYARGVNWYRAQFPTIFSKTYAEKVRKHSLITGEASPYYLFHPLVPMRVAKLLPDVKLIVLLRNPVDRAYSQHWLEVYYGFDTLPFDQAIRHEEERTSGEREKLLRKEIAESYSHRHYSYLSRGIYVDQLQYWMQYFPRDQFLLLRSEDLYSNPGSVVKEAIEFLGLPPEAIEKDRKYKKYKVPGKAGHKLNENPPPMDPAMRKYLVDYFRPHNARLKEFLGRDFNWDK